MNILDFYKRILVSAGCEVDDKGLVSRKIGENYSPLFIDGNKRLILPTKEFLDNPDWDSFCPFHPLSENIVKGESLVIKELKTLMNFKIMEVASQLSMELMDVAVDIDSHKKLGRGSVDFLKMVPNVNAKTITCLSKILCALSVKGERRLSSIYIKRGGTHNGDSYKRVAVISFPFTEEINKDEKEIYDVKLTIADKAAIKNLFYYILPNADQPGFYNAGSNCDYAPNFASLCGAFLKVMKQLNSIILVFKNRLSADELLTDISWEEDLGVLSGFYNQIPPLPYNDGENSKVPDVNVAASVSMGSPVSMVSQTPTVVVPAIQMPTMAPIVPFNQPVMQAPVETSEDGKVSWNSIVSRNPSLATYPQMQLMGGQPPPAPGSYAGYDRGVQQFQQPIYQQQPTFNNVGGTGRF